MSEICIIVTIVVYLAAMLLVGFAYSKTNNDSADFYLGGRKMGPLVTAMSAEASDMSSWLLMGMPGLAYLTGIASPGWTAIGLAVGTWLNWLIVARRLRRYSANLDAITVPQFLSLRFHDQRNLLNALGAVIIIVFFIPYTASGFAACGKLFNSLFGVDYMAAMVLSAVVIVGYTIMGGFRAALHRQQPGGAEDDALKYLVVVIFQMALDAKACAQGRCEQPAAGRGADQRERRQLDLDRTCRRAFVEYDVDLVVLHRRVEVLLDDRAQAVYLVDEKHVAGVEVGQQSGQVARLVQHGTRCDAQLRVHFVGDDVGKGRLAQSRGAVQQYVVERIAAHERRLDENMEVVDDLVLPGEGFQLLRTYLVFEFEIALCVAYD